MSKALDKAYLLKQLKGYDSEIAAKKYVAQETNKGLISDSDLAKIGTNETAIGNVSTLVGSIPATATATTVVGYAKEVADAAQAAATYDDTALAARVSTNEGDISGLKTLAGTIPSGATATDLVGYAQEVATAAQTAATYDDTTVKAGIKANADAITILNGADTVAGSVAKSVADGINDFATKISDDGTINTFKELIDYAASHTAEYSTLSGSVQTNTNAIATLNGTGAGSVAKAISDSVGELGDDYDTVKAYVDAKAAAAQAAATVEFETTDINFATEW